MWYIGMYGAMAMATVLLYYKPDTSWVACVLITFGVLTVVIGYRPGHCRRRKLGWRHEARRLNTLRCFPTVTYPHPSRYTFCTIAANTTFLILDIGNLGC